MKKGSKKQPATSVRTQQAATSHLLGFEKVPFVLAKDEPKATDEELNSRYAKGEIRIVTEQARYPLAGILGMLKEEIEGENGPERRYKLDPEYQRRHRWSDERKSRLIESFLINVPVPPVFLYERDLARFEVMDGRQRLNALSEFYADGFALKGLQYWSDLDGRKYSELPSKVRDGAFSPKDAAPQGIGIGLDFKCPRKATLFAPPTDDDVVWSPMDVTSAAG